MGVSFVQPMFEMASGDRMFYASLSAIVSLKSDLTDPVAQITALLEPVATFTKLVIGSGSWSVKRETVGRPFYCAVLQGSFRLATPTTAPVTLETGDFVLLPLAGDFQTFSLDRTPADRRQSTPVEVAPGVFRVGDPTGEAQVRQLIGYGAFGSENAAVIAALLPEMLHVKDQPRLTALVRLIDDEARTPRPARGDVLTRLLDLLLVEALRATHPHVASPGLLRGLSDERLAPALRAIHAAPEKLWTISRLASEAGLSRSAFFDRFRRVVGMAPMQYLQHWRMLLAKRLLLETGATQVAARVGYSSASTFSTAFSRYAGRSPSSYKRERQAVRQAAFDTDTTLP